MKRRNREISIFSLSMMDVISGSMGAFLILVVILARQYDEQPIELGDILQLQKELVEATSSITEVSEMLVGSTDDTPTIERSLSAAFGNVERSRAYVEEVREQLEIANATINQQRERIDKLNIDLDTYVPYLLKAWWQCDAESNVEVYLWTDSVSRNESEGDRYAMPPFDPRIVQGTSFASELYTGINNSDHGIVLWSNSQSIVGENLKLYYQIDPDAGAVSECGVRGWINGKTYDIDLGSVLLTREQPWQFVGTVTMQADRTATFDLASPQEKNAERAEIRARIGE